MSTPCLSFIGIVDFSQEARWLYMTDSVADLLGFEPKELIGRPSLELVHPDEFPRVKQLHYDTIQQDKAAVLVYLRLRHKDPYKGYILCGISRTVVHNVLVGSVSFASPGAKALHNASTAQEITVISKVAANFEFRRWHDPSPMPPSPNIHTRPLPLSPSPSSSSSSWSGGSSNGSPSPRLGEPLESPRETHHHHRLSTTTPTPERETPISFDHLPNQSFRTAFILDRFSLNCTILYCSNDLLVSTTSAIGRSFFDFVASKDDGIVRDWIDCVKGWGVNERGQPSDGGFGFGRFTLLTEARESIPRVPEPPTPSRHRQGSTSRGINSRSGPGKSSRSHHPSTSHTTTSRAASSHRPPTRIVTQRSTPPQADENCEQFPVDAIFSAHSDGLMVILRRGSTSA